MATPYVPMGVSGTFRLNKKPGEENKYPPFFRIVFIAERTKLAVDVTIAGRLFHFYGLVL